jgi:hypothetical protein
MIRRVSRIIDQLSEFLANRKGLLPMLGIFLILCNLVLQFMPGLGWIVQTNLLLHLGIVIALLGFLVAWAL